MIAVHNAAMTTNGVYTFANRVIKRSIWGLFALAFSTEFKIRVTIDSASGLSTCICNTPCVLTHPEITVFPGCTLTGTGSPVIGEVSIRLSPSITVPSKGIRSPGRTKTISPTFACAAGMVSVSVPFPFAFSFSVTVLFSVTFMLIFVLDSKKARKITLAISMVLLSAFMAVSIYFGWINYNSVKLSAICQGAGEGIVVSSRGDCVAIDISKGSKGVFVSLGENAIDLGADNIDKLVIADPHPTHATSLVYLTNKIKVSEVYMPDNEEAHMVAFLMPRNINIVYYSPGEIFSLDG